MRSFPCVTIDNIAIATNVAHKSLAKGHLLAGTIIIHHSVNPQFLYAIYR